MHNGSIGVESEIGTGSTFLIRVPVSGENEPQAMMSIADPPSGNP